MKATLLLMALLLAGCHKAVVSEPEPKATINLSDSLGPSPMDTTVFQNMSGNRGISLWVGKAPPRRLRGIRDYNSCTTKWRVYRWYYIHVTERADWNGAHCDTLVVMQDEVEAK